MLRLALLLLALSGLPAAAVCSGGSLLDGRPEAAARVAEAARAVPFAEGLVWRAEAADGTALTLVGTMHAWDPRHAAQMEALAPALDAAELLVVEVTPQDEAALMARLAAEPGMAFTTGGESLLQLLGAEDWARLEAEMARRGVPGMMAAMFRPWYAMMVLAVPPCMMTDMAAGRQGLDKALIAAAASRGLPVAALDDAGAMIAQLSGESPEDQMRYLRLALRPELAGDAYTTTMIELYFRGRPWESLAFARYLDFGLPPDEQAALEDFWAYTDEVLLVGRNLAWDRRLETMVAGRRAVIAVGAAHLPGEEGLLRLLERRGYAISRVD